MAGTVISVGLNIPGGLAQCVGIDSQASLLDADTTLFHPNITSFHRYAPKLYRGKPSLSEDSSFRVQQAVEHWRRELLDFLKTVRTVFLILSDLDEVYVDTGRREFSGTGRNRQTTNIVNLLSNYDFVPFIKVVEVNGSAMKLNPENTLLREYWQRFGEESQYRVYMDDVSKVNSLVVTRDGSRVVGGLFRTKGGGTLIALPWMDFARLEFFDSEKGRLRWTRKAVEWWRNYIEALTSIDSAIRSQSQATPIPQWAKDNAFVTGREAELTRNLLAVQGKITSLEKNREDLEAQRTDAGWLKALLFEQGKPLEAAVLHAMRLLGFEANNYRDSTSEFDAVLECPEGRLIGEVEGRDNRAIDINKIRQLIVNIQEDFAREEVLELAKGVLFGNANRLTTPSERPAEHFTAKCVTSAQRSGIALVRTCDLFEVARALIDNPDESYAAACRQAILDASGQEVQFPSRQA